MDLSIIYVNWNSVAYLRESIASVYANTHEISFEVVVVDNASPEGNIDDLSATFPNVRIIKSDVNLGFARANNLGFSKTSGAYVLLLNPDTKLVGEAIDMMMGYIRRLPYAGILGCRHVGPDMSVQTTSIQRFPTILNQFLGIERLRLMWPGCPLWGLGPLFHPVTGPVRVEIIPGACMLIRREVFEQVGMFSQQYFMYGEDLDLNYKIARAGWVNYYIPEATIIHYGGRSSSKQRGRQWATLKQHQAMDLLFTANRGSLYALQYRIVMGLSAICRLGVLVIAFPFGDREAILGALEKWSTVLKWAWGLTAAN